MSLQKRKIIDLTGNLLIKASGWITTFIIVLITIYLFKEGVGLFFSQPTMERFDVVVHKDNPVQRLSIEDLRKIKKGEIKSWEELGGFPEKIVLISPANLNKFVPEGRLGKDLEYLPEVLDSLVSANRGILLAFPADVLPKDKIKVVKVPNISLPEVLFNKRWYPTSKPFPSFGILALIVGKLWVTFGAIVLAFPLGLAIAIGLAELLSPRMRRVVKVFVELFAAIPSVVFGFFGLIVIVPILKDMFNVPVGESALAGSLILALMSLPTIVSIAEDALSSVPVRLKEASLALGATKLQTIFLVVLPVAIPRIITGVILSLGRAAGETAPILFTVAAYYLPKVSTSIWEPSMALPYHLYVISTSGTDIEKARPVAFGTALVLLVIVLFFNLTATYIRYKYERKNKK